MKRIVIHALIALFVLNLPIAAWADPQPEANASNTPNAATEAAPAQEPKERKNSVTVTYGTYRLARNTQDLNLVGPYSCTVVFFFTICGNSLTPLENHFDTFAHDVAGLEYERKLGRHMGYGATWFHTKNTFVTPTLSPATGVVKADFVLATLTAYLREPGTAQPFFGLGVGQVSTSFGGAVHQGTTGDAMMGRAGFRYQTDRANFVLGYRYVRTRGGYLGGGGQGTVSSGTSSMDLSGSGVYLGAGLRF